jgi:hypothetical protein
MYFHISSSNLSFILFYIFHLRYPISIVSVTWVGEIVKMSQTCIISKIECCLKWQNVSKSWQSSYKLEMMVSLLHAHNQGNFTKGVWNFLHYITEDRSRAKSSALLLTQGEVPEKLDPVRESYGTMHHAPLLEPEMQDTPYTCRTSDVPVTLATRSTLLEGPMDLHFLWHSVYMYHFKLCIPCYFGLRPMVSVYKQICTYIAAGCIHIHTISTSGRNCFWISDWHESMHL